MELPRKEDFLLHLHVDGYSEKTIYNYDRDLVVFEKYLQKEMETPFKQLKRRDIELYKAYLVSRDRRTADSDLARKLLGGFSINRMLSSLRSYLKFLIENDYPTPISPEMVKLTKTVKKHPQVAEFQDLVRLIESPTEFESKVPIVALRNRAMLEVLFATGMRISELVSLNCNQIDASGKIFITGKGRRQRFVYLTPRALVHINAYLAKRRNQSPALFVPLRGANVHRAGARISVNYLQMKIRQYRERLRINVPTSAHSLRHGFATYLAERGANPAALQILLGHESLETTTRYVHASDRYAAEVHRRFHPLSGRNDQR